MVLIRSHIHRHRLSLLQYLGRRQGHGCVRAQSKLSPLSTMLTECEVIDSNRSDCFEFSLLLAYGVAASGLSLVGCSSDVRRFYSTSVTHCESVSKPPDTDNKRNKGDFFFDIAQLWTLNNQPKSEDERQQSASKSNNVSSNDNADTNIFRSPEEFLKGMGAWGSPTLSEKRHADPTVPPDNTASPLSDVKDLFQTYKHKIQESFPKPSPVDNEIIKGVDTRDDSRMSDFISFFFSSDKQSSNDISELIQKAHNIVNPSSSSITGQSSLISSIDFVDLIRYFKKNSDDVQRAFESSFGKLFSSYGLSLSDLFEKMNIATLHYYLERQDSIKTPSWKRRVHRFYSEVDVKKVEELNEALLLSELSYADSVDEVREGLSQLCSNKNDDDRGFISERFRRKGSKPQWELVFCDIESRPNEPSHFLAIQKNASKYDDTLHVLLVVRGTKSMSDLMTDALLEASDYEYIESNGEILRGKAHSGMVKSGQYLVKRHQKLLSTLVGLSNKRKIEINLIGHSMGAGAATIAAMEWNSKKHNQDIDNMNIYKSDNIEISAHVIGFGCPALLSKPLSVMTQEYCTTVIADADMIPRMSGATLVNLVLDLVTFDYRKEAERDVEQALRELQCRFGGSDMPRGKRNKLSLKIEDETIQKVMGYVHEGLDKIIAPSSLNVANSDEYEEHKMKEFQRIEPVLFPPGTCVHFFRDGSGISGTYTPCTFYDEVSSTALYISLHYERCLRHPLFLYFYRWM